MTHIKYKVPVFDRGVRIHNTGDVVEVATIGEEYAAKALRRGQAEAYKPAAAPPAEKGDGKKGKAEK